MAEEHATLRHAKVVGAATFLSRILGLLRDMLGAYVFGTSAAMDAFVLAFTIPNLFRALFGEGALSAAFIPIYTELREKGRGEDARDLFSATFSWVLFILLGLVLLGGLGCVVWHAFSGPSSKGRLFVTLLQAMLPYAPLICLTALVIAALQAHGRFLVPALSPVVLNLVWIGGLLFLTPWLGIGGVAAAIVLAGVLQLLIQLGAARRIGLTPRLTLTSNSDNLRRVALLMLPVVVGMGVTRLNVLFDRVIAEVCIPGDGALAALYFGDRLMELPVGVIGIALATAVFPALARRVAGSDRTGFAEETVSALRMAFFLATPAVAMGIVLREPIVCLVYTRGEFDPESARRTAAVLAWYIAGLWAYCGVQVVTRAFYALQDTRTPVRIAMGIVALDVVLNLILVWPMAERGLALTTSISAAVNFFLLLRTLDARLDGLSDREGVPQFTRPVWTSLGRCAGCGVAAALAAWATLAAIGQGGASRAGGMRGEGLGFQLVAVFVPALAGSAAFLVLSLLLRMREGHELLRALLPKSRKGRGGDER